MSSHRLPPQPREWINRDDLVRFQFEGNSYRGFAGDVVSSAVLAGGCRTLARSFKYHRRRGVLSCANHDANVLLQTTAQTNIRGDIAPAENGAVYRAVNTLGGVERDLGQVIQALSPVLPVGFYYKAFYRPRWLFPYWEWLIRQSAGLGKVDTRWPGARPQRCYRSCDVLIVGAGSAGLAAAAALSAAACDVVVVDENRRAGGSLDYTCVDDDEAQAFKGDALARVTVAANIEVLTDAYAAGCYDEFTLPVMTPAGVQVIEARTVIFATGLIEQPAVFRNNDLPGVMLASGAQRLVQRFAVAPCRTAAILSANIEGYRAARELSDAGMNIAALIDMGETDTDRELQQDLTRRHIQIIPNAHVAEAVARRGELSSLRIRSNDGRVTQDLHADGLLMSVGWAPAASLVMQAGGTFGYDTDLEQTVPVALPVKVFCAGSLNGHFDVRERIADGRAAAADALQALDLPGAGNAQRLARASVAHSHPYPVHAHPKGGEYVDFDEDLQIKDLEIGIREGFDSIELIKRYSSIGMGPSQGKVSNMNGVRYLARYHGCAIGAIGTTTPRPFYHPVPMGALAGRRLRREWHTPMHEFHLARGADMMDTGAWRRPKSYAAGSSVAQIQAEYRAVREAVGVIDVSTLGKIELFGPDAAPLLEYAYTCGFGKLVAGQTRYIFMVDSSGTIVDDGVAGRLGDGHFYITATSTHSQTVLRQLQLFADQLSLDVAIIDRTFQLAAVNLAGPLSLQVMSRLTNLDLGEEAFPYLALREAEVASVPCRLMRVGFVGERSYEIHCAASQAVHLWEALFEAGADESIRPFGVEAQRLLRLEKGHVIIGQDTDGTTNPFEIGLGWGVKLSKPRFHGKHSLTQLKPMLRRRLVGFRAAAADASAPIEECHLIIERGEIAGRVTSVAFSPTVGEVIGLAYVDKALAEPGRIIAVRTTSGHLVSVTICKLPFYDPENERQKILTDPALKSVV